MTLGSTDGAVHHSAAATRAVVAAKDDTDDKVRVYTALLNQLRNELKQQIPSDAIDNNLRALFLATCDAVVSSEAARDAADRARNAIPADADQGQRDAASKAVDAADAALQKAVAANIAAAGPILDCLHLDHSVDTTKLMQCFVLTHGTPQALGEFANRGPDQAALIDGLLQSKSLLKQTVLAAGARAGNYGDAMTIYADIAKQGKETANHDVLRRLALATALEHSEPMAEFDTPNVYVDPVKRYMHYERAYLSGELDPSFEDRTVWDCRMVCNCDAPDEQLGWGREMLRNYRPDEVLESDYLWRYCKAVRTEVGYRNPEWTASPHTYQQIISGGGKCGPRAWFGRFICKSFGVPTWGAQQPGHAMMHHWTPQGWVTVLGADWKHSYWEGQCGLNFLLDTKARAAGEDEYFAQVCRLEMISTAVLCEPELDRMTVLPTSQALWGSLALMAKHILGNSKAKSEVAQTSPVSQVHNRINRRLTQPETHAEIPIVSQDKIIIPAAGCSSPKTSTKNILFTKSFLGGQQLHHTQDEAFEYTLTDIAEGGDYDLILRVCTVHLKQQPLLLTVTSGGTCDDDMVNVATIVVPYTVGGWQYTDPITVLLSQGTNILSFTREAPNFGLSIKDITLTPRAMIDG